MRKIFGVMINKVKQIYSRAIYSFYFGNIGEGTWIGKPLRIINGKRVLIGNNCWILNGLRIEAIVTWKGIKFNPTIEICDKVSIQQNVHITCAEKIHIGNGTCVLANSCITDISHSYSNIDMSPNEQLIDSLPVYIGRNCLIGFGSVILPGVTLGDNVTIGANSVVTHSIPENCVAAGNPARILKRFNFEKKEWDNEY